MGFEVFGDGGNLQASDTVRNFVLIQKGTIYNQTVAAFAPNSITCNASTTMTGFAPEAPILAFRNGNQPGGYRGVVITGSGTTKQYVFQAWPAYPFPPPSPNTQFVNYYIFDLQPNDPDAGQGGLITYDASGNVVFNSKYKPMIIGGTANLADVTVLSSPQTRATITGLSTSRTWAGACTLPIFWVRTDLTINEFFGFTDLIDTGTAGQVRDYVGQTIQQSGRANFNNVPFTGGQLLAIDVTGL